MDLCIQNLLFKIHTNTPTIYTPTTYTPTTYTPTIYTPTTYTPTIYTPTIYTPTIYTPTIYTPSNTSQTPKMSGNNREEKKQEGKEQEEKKLVIGDLTNDDPNAEDASNSIVRRVSELKDIHRNITSDDVARRDGRTEDCCNFCRRLRRHFHIHAISSCEECGSMTLIRKLPDNSGIQHHCFNLTCNYNFLSHEFAEITQYVLEQMRQGLYCDNTVAYTDGNDSFWGIYGNGISFNDEVYILRVAGMAVPDEDMSNVNDEDEQEANNRVWNALAILSAPARPLNLNEDNSDSEFEDEHKERTE